MVCGFCVVPSEMFGHKEVDFVYIVLCFKRLSKSHSPEQ